MRKYLLSLFISIFAFCLAIAQVTNAQIKFTGKITDANTQEALIGATVTLKGTSTATTTSLDGSFKLTVPAGSQVLVITYVGYVPQEITVHTGKTDLGNIILQPSSASMNEVTITGDIAIDRKTPVAVSTLGPQYIEDHIGNQDIPELLSITPGVMATASGGGYGDSRISIRGFSSGSNKGNVALTVNGISVTDAETGAIFWSDFSGLTDVVTSVQIQRGLGASKIVVPSFGGTINITTRNTDAVQGGYVSQTVGSDGYDKTAVLISTGLDKNGWAATFQGSRNMGNGDAQGLNFLGYNYFFNLSKVLSPNQRISFSVMGASQNHGQRPEETIADYQNAPQGIKWNYDLGVKDGQQINPYNNFFSEPLFFLNHDWTINSKSSLTTVVYAQYGTGGAGELGGTAAPRVAGTNIYTPFDYTAVEKTNATSVDGSAGSYFFVSHNDHLEYGLRSTYKTLLGKNIDFSAGIALKHYSGNHYDVVSDLLGADYVKNDFTGTPALGSGSGNINQPIDRAVVGDKISFFNKDYIESAGAFSQAEYSKDNFTAFITLSGSESADKRTDYFNYLNSDPNQTTPWIKFFTYETKGGANYNINDQMNLYANIGFITKPPYFATVFENFTNEINKNPVPEKLFSYELGYGYKIPGFSAKVDLYRSLYMNETLNSTYTDATTQQLYSSNVTGVTEMHQGAELELRAKPIRAVTLIGMLSLGDWYYTKNAGPANVYNSQQTLIATVPQVDLQGIKVGDAAQTTAALGIDIDVLPALRVGATSFFYGNYYSNFTAADVTTPGLEPYKIPDYTILNLNAIFKFKISGLDAQLIGNVFNLMNTKYISDALDAAASGQAQNVSVYYGLGRTFTTGLKIKF